jgi:hypothetical protein
MPAPFSALQSPETVDPVVDEPAEYVALAASYLVLCALPPMWQLALVGPLYATVGFCWHVNRRRAARSPSDAAASLLRRRAPLSRGAALDDAALGDAAPPLPAERPDADR